MEMNAEALRFLAAGNPLFGGQFPFGAAGGVPGTSPADAFRAMAAQAGLPFPVMYPGLQPVSFPQFLRFCSSFFFVVFVSNLPIFNFGNNGEAVLVGV